jgi:hypothetical protein
MLVVLFGLSTARPLAAQDQAGPLLAAGECTHAPQELTPWLFTMGFRAVASSFCASARVDWDGSITFYRDAKGEVPGVEFIGEPVAGGFRLKLTGKREFGETKPVTGYCRQLIVDGVGPRRIQCFAQEEFEGEPTATLSEFTYADEPWPLGGNLNLTGRCEASGIAEYVLIPWIAEFHGLPKEHNELPSPACDAVAIAPESSYRFIDRATGAETAFTGRPRPGTYKGMEVDSVTLPDGTEHKPLIGVCYATRESDGEFIPLCFAAIGPAEAPTLIEYSFIPAGSRFQWPVEPSPKE